MQLFSIHGLIAGMAIAATLSISLSYPLEASAKNSIDNEIAASQLLINSINEFSICYDNHHLPRPKGSR